VTEHDGQLQLALGPKNQTFPLTHWDGDTFSFALTNENARPERFPRPPSSVPRATLNLEYYDTDNWNVHR